MRTKRDRTFLAIFTALLIFTYTLGIGISEPVADAAVSNSASDSNPVPGSCTMFMASFGDTVFYGNNEDYNLTLTYYWVGLPGKDTYGGVYLGHYSSVDIWTRGLERIYAQGTEYSNVFDLKKRVIYLNHWHQFDETASINVAEEMARQSASARRGDKTADQPMPLRIKDLFSPETVRKAEQEHQEYKDKK